MADQEWQLFMNPHRLEFLNLRTLPARLTAEETAWLLGFNLHDMPVLVSTGLIKPLGQPAQNSVKYFATVTVCELKRDVQWQSRATKAITLHWRNKNQRKDNESGPRADQP